MLGLKLNHVSKRGHRCVFWCRCVLLHPPPHQRNDSCITDSQLWKNKYVSTKTDTCVAPSQRKYVVTAIYLVMCSNKLLQNGHIYPIPYIPTIRNNNMHTCIWGNMNWVLANPISHNLKWNLCLIGTWVESTFVRNTVHPVSDLFCYWSTDFTHIFQVSITDTGESIHESVYSE